MAKTTFTFDVEDGLKEAFIEAARARHLTGDQLLQDFMSEIVSRRDHDAWLETEVRRGIAEAERDHSLRRPHEEVMDAMKSRLEARIAGAGKRAG